MYATIFTEESKNLYTAIVFNERGYQLGRRQFSFHMSSGLAHAREWLEEHWDLPVEKITVEGFEETEVWLLYNGVLMDNEGEQQIRQPKLFHTVAEAQNWLNGQYDEECPITIKAGRRIGQNIVVAE